MFAKSVTLASFDPEIQSAIEAEAKRQETHIELIASENFSAKSYS